jgi:tetraacyldisaccharide 4'-kinase
MARATHILLTRCDQAQDLDALVAQVEARCPGRPIRRTRHAPSRLWRVATEAPEPLETLSGVQVTAVCGIARPEAFVRTVEELGAQVVEVRAFPDHGHIPSDAFSCEGLVVTTEKDAMRLADVGENVLALGIELRDL